MSSYANASGKLCYEAASIQLSYGLTNGGLQIIMGSTSVFAIFTDIITGNVAENVELPKKNNL